MNANKVSQVITITDCRDDDARMRLTMRAQALFGVPAIFAGAESTLQAGGMIVDALDAAIDTPIVILANVAPRNGEVRHRYTNGTPFGYVQIGNALVFGTIDGFIFSLLQKVLGHEIKVAYFDIPAVAHLLGVDGETAQMIVNTQFRSFEFLPRVAHKVVTGTSIPTKPAHLTPEAPYGVWHVDNFGNMKLSILPEDIGFEPSQVVKIRLPYSRWIPWLRRNVDVKCYARLKDVPDDQLGLIIGSSGYQQRRWLELVVQGKSAAKRCHLKPGSVLDIMPCAKQIERRVAENEMAA